MPKFREIPKVFHTLDAYDPFVARKELPQNFYILRQLLRSVCGIVCGQRKYEKIHSAKKLQKAKENTRNSKISGVFLELLGGFEPPTSSLPSDFWRFL